MRGDAKCKSHDAVERFRTESLSIDSAMAESMDLGRPELEMTCC